MMPVACVRLAITRGAPPLHPGRELLRDGTHGLRDAPHHFTRGYSSSPRRGENICGVRIFAKHARSHSSGRRLTAAWWRSWGSVLEQSNQKNTGLADTRWTECTGVR